MFTHLLMESGFGASFELGRTPKPAGPLPRQRPQPGATGRALSATRPTGAADGHRAPSHADSTPGRRMRRRPGRVGVSKARVAGETQSSGQGKERKARVLISHRHPAAFATREQAPWPCWRGARDRTEDKGKLGAF